MINRLPPWFRQEIPDSSLIKDRVSLFRDLKLSTVCESARCPNLYDCFKRNTATFMILGDVCTRNCRFCCVKKGRPLKIDPQEPENIVSAIKALRLKYAVITSVSRDDLSDGGAGQFALTIERLRRQCGKIKIEVLVPDFKGETANLEKVINARPDVIAHNLETVPRLYPAVRPEADYKRSLELLDRVKKIDGSILTKSGIMAGLGEDPDEVKEVTGDLRRVNCDILTLGQYLPPSPEHLPVKRFLPPAEFLKLKQAALHLGFKQAYCGPLVRSSFYAEECFSKILNNC